MLFAVAALGLFAAGIWGMAGGGFGVSVSFASSSCAAGSRFLADCFRGFVTQAGKRLTLANNATGAQISPRFKAIPGRH